MKEKISKNNLLPKKSMVLEALRKAGSKSNIRKEDLPDSYKGTVKNFKLAIPSIAVDAFNLISSNYYGVAPYTKKEIIKYLIAADYRGNFFNDSMPKLGRDLISGDYIKIKNACYSFELINLGEKYSYDQYYGQYSKYSICVSRLHKSKLGLWNELSFFDTGRNASASFITHLKSAFDVAEIKEKRFSLNGYIYSNKFLDIKTQDGEIDFGRHLVEISVVHKKTNYHLPVSEFPSLSQRNIHALLKPHVDNKILKKNESNKEKINKPIEFSLGEKLGFCEVGMQEFCEILNINIDGVYKSKFIFDEIHKNMDDLISYKDEIATLARRVNQKSPFINELQDI